MQFVKPIFCLYLLMLLSLFGSAQPKPKPEDKNKKQVVKKYDEVGAFEYGIARVRNGSLYGVIDKNGKEIIPLNYSEDELKLLNEGYIASYEFEIGWGVKDRFGKQILEPGYGEVSDLRYGLICISYNEGWALFNLKGKQVNATLFYEPVNWDWNEEMPGTAAVRVLLKQKESQVGEDQTLMGLINKKGEFILLPVFDGFSQLTANYLKVYKGNKVAVLTLKGDTVFSFKYNGIEVYYENYFSVELNQHFGLIDAKGKTILPIEFDILNAHYYDGTSNPKCHFAGIVGQVSKNGFQTYILPDLSFLTPFIYQNIKPFVNNYAAVKRSDLWTFIDTTGKELVPPQFDEVFDFYQGLAASVKKGGKWGLINTSGELLTPIVYDYELGSPSGHDFVDVRKNGKYGKLDSSFKELIPCLYDVPIEHIPGYVTKNGKVALINKDGKLITDFLYDYIGDRLYPERSFHYSSMRIGNKWGFIDNKGKVLFPPQFDEVFGGSFKSYWVKIGSDYGFINAAAKFIIPCKYQDILYLENALFAVKTNGKYAFLDSTTLDLLFAPRFEDVRQYTEGYIPVKLNNKWGFANKKGGVAIPCAYEYACTFSEGRAAVKLFGKWGFIDKAGTMVIPPKYDSPGWFVQNRVTLELNRKQVTINRAGALVK
ncbi:MAG: hypothetical protein CFE21_09985 [Bacteroidetes bacterium B1(2017)]|nr:MAG: hypothetical protein CFE21_09985 [Bacteroidetes bacterium B1(2017)]